MKNRLYIVYKERFNEILNMIIKSCFKTIHTFSYSTFYVVYAISATLYLFYNKTEKTNNLLVDCCQDVFYFLFIGSFLVFILLNNRKAYNSVKERVGFEYIEKLYPLSRTKIFSGLRAVQPLLLFWSIVFLLWGIDLISYNYYSHIHNNKVEDLLIIYNDLSFHVDKGKGGANVQNVLDVLKMSREVIAAKQEKVVGILEWAVNHPDVRFYIDIFSWK